MNKVNKTISMMMATLMMASTAFAEGVSAKDPTAAPRVEKRIERQKGRISRKLSKGKITQEEANQLNANVDAVKSKEEELKKDGKLTRGERKGLHEKLNQNSKEIKSATDEKAPPTGH